MYSSKKTRLWNSNEKLTFTVNKDTLRKLIEKEAIRLLIHLPNVATETKRKLRQKLSHFKHVFIVYSP